MATIRLDKIADFLDAQVEDVVTAVKLETFNEAVAITRVDTGRLRGNWQISGGSPSRRRTRGIRRRAAVERDIELHLRKAKPWEVTYLTNNLPYAPVINRRDNILRRSVRHGRRAIKRARGR